MLALNDGDEDHTLSMHGLTLACPADSQVGSYRNAAGDLVALAAHGAVANAAGELLAGDSRALFIALDNRDLSASEAVLALPLSAGTLRLTGLPAERLACIGEVVDGAWRTYETLPKGTDLALTPLRSTAMLLICAPTQRDKWADVVGALVTAPEGIPVR